jgi:hypothetical protein
MSQQDDFNSPVQNQPSLDTIVSQLQLLTSSMSDLLDILTAAFPRILGSFTTTATTTQAIPAPTITANAQVNIQPTNATAATLQGGAKALYIASVTAGVGFTVATADGTNATVSATFSYAVTNPV